LITIGDPAGYLAGYRGFNKVNLKKKKFLFKKINHKILIVLGLITYLEDNQVIRVSY